MNIVVYVLRWFAQYNRERERGAGGEWKTERETCGVRREKPLLTLLNICNPCHVYYWKWTRHKKLIMNHCLWSYWCGHSVVHLVLFLQVLFYWRWNWFVSSSTDNNIIKIIAGVTFFGVAVGVNFLGWLFIKKGKLNRTCMPFHHS